MPWFTVCIIETSGCITAEQIAKAQELSKEMIKKNPKLIQKKD